jgi:hypothetical protein
MTAIKYERQTWQSIALRIANVPISHVLRTPTTGEN